MIKTSSKFPSNKKLAPSMVETNEWNANLRFCMTLNVSCDWIGLRNIIVFDKDHKLVRDKLKHLNVEFIKKSK